MIVIAEVERTKDGATLKVSQSPSSSTMFYNLANDPNLYSVSFDGFASPRAQLYLRWFYTGLPEIAGTA